MSVGMSVGRDQLERVRSDFVTLVGLYGLTMPSQDAGEVIIRKIAQAICNYCNIESVPRMLEGVWVDMCIDYLRYLLAVKDSVNPSTDNAGKSKVPTYVSSINELSVSVGFNADDTSEQVTSKNAHDVTNGVDGIVLNYVDQLNRFRRMTW